MRILTAIIVFFLMNLILLAQAPQIMSYQAVVRNNAGELVRNQPVGVRVSILKGTIDGTEVFKEIFNPNPQTNINGLVTFEIGAGITLVGSFPSIDWANGLYFIKTEVDPTGGTNYSIVSTNQLLSVPYALHAKTAESIAQPITETDPVFTAWDRSSGIEITESQITDLKKYLTSILSESIGDLSDIDLAGLEMDKILKYDQAKGVWVVSDDMGLLEETDPLFSDSPSANIKDEHIGNWNESHLWGNHAENSYLTEETQTLEGVLEKGNEGGDMQIKRIADPTDPQDVVTLSYFDDIVSMLLGKITNLEDQLSQIGIADFFPVVTTNTVTNILSSTAISGGNVTFEGLTSVTQRGVVWNTSENPTTSINLGMTIGGTGMGSFTSIMTDLAAETTYYVRAYAINSLGTAYGNQVTFTTSLALSLPTVITTAITNITQTTATGGGNVTSDGNAAITARGIVWSTSTNPTTGSHQGMTTNGTSAGSFESNLMGLTPGTPYYVRAYAINSLGAAYGNQVTFTTSLPLSLPTVITTAITDITQTTATGGGNVTSDGNAAVTAKGIVLSTSQNPTIFSNHGMTSDGTGTGSFTSSLTGLTPGTPYYVRAYATNSQGTTYGNQESFTTLQLPDKFVISFESNFNPILPAFARLLLWSSSLNVDQNMINASGVYVFELPSTINQDVEFTIETNNYPECYNPEEKNEWVSSKSGIRAKRVKINDTVLDESFLFYNFYKDGANFIFKMNQSGDIVPGSGETIPIDRNIPAEVAFRHETIHLVPSEISNKYANAWFSVIHDTNKEGVSKVEIDTLKLYARLSNGHDILLAFDSYESIWGGKLYIRYPYFDCSLDEQFQWTMPAEIIDDKLTFSPSDITNRVWHGWCTGPWQQVPLNTNSLWVEAKVKITGNALIQLGVDVKNNRDANDGYSEYGTSNWSFETNGFQKIYFNKP